MDIFSRPLIRITALFFALAVAETGWLHTLLPLEKRLSDFFVRQQGQKLAPDPQIVIVDIDEASLARMQDVAGNWPWPRAVHGELVRGIAAQRPAAIVFDILFSERDQYRPESDRLFNEALETHDNIYFPMVRRDPALDAQGAPLIQIAPLLGLTRTGRADPEARVALLPPLAIDPRHWRSGTINFEEDRDGVGRRYRLYTEAYGWLIPSLPARVAAGLGYPVPQQDDMILAWRGKAHSFSHVSYAELYEDFERERPQRPRDEFTGKIVIVGADATGLHDMRVTPLASLHPGVEILATALDDLKNRRMMQAAPAWFAALLALGLLAALAAALLSGINLLRSGLGLAVASALLLGG